MENGKCNLGYWKVSGIYLWVNLVNGKKYVGTAVNLTERMKVHRKLSKNIATKFRRTTSGLRHLYNSINQYGMDNFVVYLLEKVDDRSNLLPREAYWIQYYDAINNGYNVSISVTNPFLDKEMQKMMNAKSAAFNREKAELNRWENERKAFTKMSPLMVKMALGRVRKKQRQDLQAKKTAERIQLSVEKEQNKQEMAEHYKQNIPLYEEARRQTEKAFWTDERKNMYHKIGDKFWTKKNKAEREQIYRKICKSLMI
jgi:group I intron endonuclease